MCKIGDKSSPFFISFVEILLRKSLVFYKHIANIFRSCKNNGREKGEKLYVKEND